MPITIKTLLPEITQQLKQAGFSEPRHEASLLVREVLRLSMLQMYQGADQVLTPAETKQLRLAAQERCRGVPLAYITGHTFFFDLSFNVCRDVLIPRADSEILVEQGLLYLKKRQERMSADMELTLKKPDGKEPIIKNSAAQTQFMKDFAIQAPVIKVLDLCTGTGCIGISLSVKARDEGIQTKLVLTDISPAAIACAQSNLSLHHLQTTADVVQTDLFPDKQTFFDVITANPPYIPDSDIQTLMPEVKEHEPHLALKGGRQGLDFYIRILASIENYLKPGGLLLLEHGYNQGDAVQKLLCESPLLTDIAIWQDYAGQDRVSGGYRKNQA